jgi:hypothetical protein
MTTLQAQLRIELRDVKPLAWRRILVPENLTLAKLHLVLQATMGWSHGHLHELEIARQRYGTPNEDWPDNEPVVDERRVRLKPFIEHGVRRFTYLYDFADNWEHLIKIEDLVLPRSGAPRLVCLGGENAMLRRQSEFGRKGGKGCRGGRADKEHRLTRKELPAHFLEGRADQQVRDTVAVDIPSRSHGKTKPSPLLTLGRRIIEVRSKLPLAPLNTNA